MKMDMINTMQGQKHCSRYMHLIEIRQYSLFDFRFKVRENQQFESGDISGIHPERFGYAVDKAKEVCDYPDNLVYLHSACDASQSLTVCPPLFDAKTGLVIYDDKEYQKAIQFDGLPVFTFDMEDIWGYSNYNPNALKDHPQENAGENAPEKVGD